jgi:DMSO reductase anchor subunit
MAMPNLAMVGDTFQVGYRFQRYWDTPMANAFFFGELGAGLFSVSMLFDFVLGMTIGLLTTGIFKPYFHLAHMGVPLRSWRALVRPDRSWTSRGLIGIAIFMGAGSVHTLNVAFDLETTLGLGSALGSVVQLTAAAAALVVMTYQGFAMAHSTAISLWDTKLMPVSSLLYALIGGVVLTLALGWNGWLAESPESLRLLVNAALILMVLILIMLLSILRGAHQRSAGGRLSVEMLVQTQYAKWFIPLVGGIGLVLPAVLLSLARANYIAILVAAAAVLGGFYAYRVLIMKVGVFEPIMDFRP